MNKSFFLVTFAVMIISFSAVARGNSSFRPDAIYGRDDRRDVYQVDNRSFITLARSTAAQILEGDMDFNPATNSYNVFSGTLQASMNLCSNAQFAKQSAAANCSGFLVAPDLLVTAGHCVQNMHECNGGYWVFDYKLENPAALRISNIAARQVYRCVEIIEQTLDDEAMNDYALIRLDRVVTDRTPLKIRQNGQISSGTSVVVVGHPSGLPTKISAGAVVIDNGPKNYFVTNLDTFAGNSGSAVFNAETNEIEGILVRGEEDYVPSPMGDCMIPRLCRESGDGCLGEHVTRITNIAYLKGY
ncbi:MAG: hypothetical protein A2504_14100 [Bdellovibrionales bacterium RIFOXYD12_FULL_39_22]|nr:MAG: hypothetical protein A2385_04535 [Bdellovibrionales bacterium RIFOXYB1_FULL_39_21]OFZ43415.1 MAG: hypothetical protein A2485_13050 [Bdellovibrionales bacterium RIFOXYC12_FULL_39_17]OFZ46958.1 MAG: hypothetical protein A2404_00110 [Bdellovibrionales bacterium RIFOXYC1_FULL_39_130]OFZ72220.1 MAG: hypothetical protein A2451_16880 [Bdellovibrionales bacterium RIFOXYC2_FULL_39_8]OFZ76155.1 MAG: hypothetical protein A2560_07360 [Bdellovibrionales bacterium RIFOXYD1_FULL_39_84]OFZ94390.1 MAG: